MLFLHLDSLRYYLLALTRVANTYAFNPYSVLGMKHISDKNRWISSKYYVAGTYLQRISMGLILHGEQGFR